jgi:hypothetical protein
MQPPLIWGVRCVLCRTDSNVRRHGCIYMSKSMVDRKVFDLGTVADLHRLMTPSSACRSRCRCRLPLAGSYTGTS